jgi:SulP family sulfate permease
VGVAFQYAAAIKAHLARLLDWSPFTLPILAEVRRYDRQKLRADAFAGLTIAIMSLPQAIGFALIAGLPPQMVVTSLLVGGFFAALFNSSHHTIFGPTNTVSVFLAAIIHRAATPALSPAQVAVLIGLLIGVIQLIAGLARLGNLTQFVSRSVILGYSAGVAVVIFLSQLPNLFGLAIAGDSRPIFSLWHLAFSLAHGGSHWPSVALGLACIALLFAFRRWRPLWPESLVVLALATVASVAFDWHELGLRTVADLGALNAGWPAFHGFALGADALRAVPGIMNATFALAVLGMLEAVSVSKNIAAQTGQSVEANQELLGLGVGNVVASCFGAMPGSASFMRSAVNYQSGGRTQFSAIFASAIVGLGLISIIPLANHIPIVAVAAVLVLLAGQMVKPNHVRTLCRATRSDLAVLTATFLGTLLLNLDTAIYLGIGISLALFLRKAAKPALVEYTIDDSGSLKELADPTNRRDPQVSIIHVEGELFFGAADLFQEEIRRLAADPDLRVFILRMKNARHLDGSTVLALGLLIDHLRGQGRHLLISGVHGDVARVLKRSGLIHHLGLENIFPAEENPTLATKKALVRAKALIGGGSSDVRLFYPKSAEQYATTSS